MTKVYIADTTHSITVDEAVYTVTVASAASDTQVITSGSGTSLINTSTGGITTLNSVTGGANVTITDDDAGNLTIAATEDNLSNNTTSDLPEGSNLYFTDARVDTALTTVGGNIIPATDNAQYLGSSSKRWHSLYLGPGTLYIDDHPILGSDDADTINFTTDTGQTIDIFAGGATGTAGAINMASRSNTTTLNDTTVNLGPSVGGATINALGTLEAPDLHNGDLEFSGTLINQTGSNQNLEIRTNGTGYIHWNSADVYVGPIAGAVKIDESSITTTAGNLTISATGSVDIAGHYTSAETDSAISTATAALVDSAPAALDTLNELASALGDDANFATTTATSIGTKWTQDNTKISNWDTAYGWGNHATPGYITGYTVTESDVTGHQAALTITESQISDLDHLTAAEAISAVEGESTLDLTGTVTIGDLEFTNYSQFGENFGKLKADGTNQNLCLEASNGTGYFVVKSPNQYFGAASGVKITNAAGSDTTLSGFGYQSEALNITGNLTGPVTGNVTGDLTGDVTGDVTGDLSGDLTAAKTYANTIISNADSVTIPGVSQWGGFNLFDNTGGVASATKDSNQTGGGYPFIGVTQSTSGNTQPIAQYLINNMNYDISGGLSGHGVSVAFAAQDETGRLLDIASNLCKLRNPVVSGSAGSSTVGNYDGEYTLTTFASSSGTVTNRNVITANKDFTETTKELRVVNKPNQSGNTDLSGVYLTYSGAETGVPSALLQLRKQSDDSNVENIKLEEARTTFGAVTKQYKASSDPSGEAGDTYFNTTTNKFRGHNGTAWVDIGG